METILNKVASEGEYARISLWDDEDYRDIDEAARLGYVKITMMFWGQEDVATLTNKGRELIGLPRYPSLLEDWILPLWNRLSQRRGKPIDQK